MWTQSSRIWVKEAKFSASAKSTQSLHSYIPKVLRLIAINTRFNLWMMQDDAAFVAMLNDIRTGKNRAVLQEIVKQCSRPLESLNGVFPTILYAK
jgi:hypothetical protein